MLEALCAPKEVFWYTSIYSLLVDDVVTASAMKLETSLAIVTMILSVLMHVVSYKLFCNWICVLREVWCDNGFVIWQVSLFDTNCVIVIIKYWTSNHLQYQSISRQNKTLEIKCATELLWWWKRRVFMQKMCCRADCFVKPMWNKMRGPAFLKQNAPLRLVCPIDMIGNLFFTNHSPESFFLK